MLMFGLYLVMMTGLLAGGTCTGTGGHRIMYHLKKCESCSTGLEETSSGDCENLR